LGICYQDSTKKTPENLAVLWKTESLSKLFLHVPLPFIVVVV